jgi:hypothetical protein
MLAVTKKDDFCCVCAVVYFKRYAFLVYDCLKAVYCIMQTMWNRVDTHLLNLNTLTGDL